MITTLLAAAAAAASPAAGASGADAADGRCIALLNFMVQKGTPEQQNAGRAGTIYFIGKLRGRNPNSNIPVILKSAADAATQAKMNPQAEIKRCGDEVTTAANSLGAAPAAPPATPRKP